MIGKKWWSQGGQIFKRTCKGYKHMTKIKSVEKNIKNYKRAYLKDKKFCRPTEKLWYEKKFLLCNQKIHECIYREYNVSEQIIYLSINKKFFMDTQ